MAATEDITLPKAADAGRAPAEAAAEERSLIDDVEVLIEDGKTYLQAELNFQKTRAAFIADGAKGVALWVLVGFVFAWMALIGLTVGLIIALTPPLSAWGATAVVVIVWLLIAVIAMRVAAGRWRALAKSFQPDGSETP